MISGAQSTDPCQILPPPDDSAGILWIAEQHQGDLRIAELLFQIRPVHFIAIGSPFQWILNRKPAVIANTVEKDIVDEFLMTQTNVCIDLIGTGCTNTSCGER